MKIALPNALTLSNLVLGSIAILCLLYGHLEASVWLVGFAIVADFFDGAAARWLGVSSPLGKQLDSLADVVSFGVVPGVMFYGLIAAAWSEGVWPEDIEPAALPAFILSAFAALRLGKFNLDERQQQGFIGLPTPACTLFVSGLVLIYQNEDLAWGRYLFEPWVLYVLVAILCWLLVAEIPMFSLKFKGFQWKGNEIKYIFMGVSFVLLILLKGAAFSAIILFYIGLSAGLFLFRRKK